MIKYATLRGLVPQKTAKVKKPSVKQLEGTVVALGAGLKRMKETFQVQINLQDSRKEHSFLLLVHQSGGRVERARRKNSEIELSTTTAVWWEMARGKLSPLEAFRRGLVGFRGDEKVAMRAFSKLAGRAGKREICGG